jgi:hypothetical protein
MRYWILVIAVAMLSHAQTRRVMVMGGPPPNTRSIWVLGPDNRLSRYDTAQFKMWMGGMPLPADARKNPEAISISAAGEVLFALPTDGQSTLRRWWRSVPTHSELIGGAWDKRPAASGGYSILSASPALYFGSDGERLFWFEHREQRLNRGGPDISRDARFLAWTTNLDGEDPQKIVEFTFPSCKCETGACQESCPEATVWAPQDSVSDFFFVTRWVPGQIQSDFQETVLYQLKNGAWTSRKLAHPVERFLDAADHGETFIQAIPDGGCCGWANDSDDQTLVVRGGADTVIFDERTRFRNDNYDVSFFTANALLSPDGARVGYTLADTQFGEQEIRLSSDGKANPAELAALRRTIADMPRVEVVALSAPKQVVFGISHAELVGWLDNQHLLILQGGELQTLDVVTRKQTPTGIKAEAAKFVFLR